MIRYTTRCQGISSVARAQSRNLLRQSAAATLFYSTKTTTPQENKNDIEFDTLGSPITRGKNSAAASKEYKLPKWKEALGEYVIKTFGLDMDKVRAGPVAGSYYYSICKEQGLQYENEPLSESAKFFYEELKLPRTFSQWFQVTILHEWMLFVRMRAMPFKYGRNYQQKLVDKTFADIEMRLFDEMNIHSGRIVDQYSKDFNSQLKGAVFAYDVGFYTDDATLATAVWRNLFGGRKNIDYAHLDAVVKYIRSQLYVMSRMSDREFALGKFKFVPASEKVTILSPAEEEEMKQRVIKKYQDLDKSGLILPSDRSNLSYEN
ncbi:Cbp3 protein [Maudiozyma humilis]|uniref:Cbp3 protein n=1 Tax=Maudiozyma humilis TaxID=51915 RepID=A0AAV5RZ58_MAUHU|nr:Cbp3 protein [Kazachstania humilis]